MLEQLNISQLRTSPQPLWAIVTSATTIYASAALPTAGIPEPPQLITADHVTKGKPHPEPYLNGAKALGLDIKDCEFWAPSRRFESGGDLVTYTFM